MSEPQFLILIPSLVFIFSQLTCPFTPRLSPSADAPPRLNPQVIKQIAISIHLYWIHKSSANGRISESSHCSHHRELKQPKMQKRIVGSTAKQQKSPNDVGGFIRHPAALKTVRLLHTARTTATYLLEVLLVIPGPGGSSETSETLANVSCYAKNAHII